MMRFVRFVVLVAAATIVLSGCASTYTLDNQVQSFSQLAGLPAQPSYRFERTLSQQADPAQPALENLADAALFKAGLRHDDTAPLFSVQVAARTERMWSPYGDDGWGPGWGGAWAGYQGHGFGLGLSSAIWPYPESYWFHREVTVVVRDLSSNKVVYETHAINDGPWLDNLGVLPAMFDAAMQGFPTPAAGPRRVDIQVGRSS